MMCSVTTSRSLPSAVLTFKCTLPSTTSAPVGVSPSCKGTCPTTCFLLVQPAEGPRVVRTSLSLVLSDKYRNKDGELAKKRDFNPGPSPDWGFRMRCHKERRLPIV